MGIIEQIILIIGLSMDGFCAAVCLGMTADRRRAFIAALITGAHIAMLLLGMALGTALPDTLQAAFPWAAGLLLGWLGVNIIRKSGAPETDVSGLSAASTVTLALATALDAMTVGVAFALMAVSPLSAAGLTFVIVGVLSFTGAAAGARLGHRHRCLARRWGGILLALLGLRLLLSAAGVL